MHDMEKLPAILTAQEIAEFLRIGRKRVYELMSVKPQHGGIPAFSVGRSRRVEKREFKKWLESQMQFG